MRRAARIDDNAMWQCQVCGVLKIATAHQRRQKTCSYECMAKSYKEKMIGSNNPNYRNAAHRNCVACGQHYESYIKTRKFCSRECANQSRIKPSQEKPKKIRHTKQCAFCKSTFFCQHSSKKTTCSTECSENLIASRAIYTSCEHCGKSFRVYKSQSRKYCSYQCHLDSGGAFRAGIASAEATLKYGPKKDANHNEVMAEMRKYCAVYDMSTAGMGLPDGIAWINEAWHLFDIKNPKTGYGRRGLNNVQKKWLEMWAGGPVYLIYTAEEAARFAQGNFDGIKFARGGKVENADTSDAEQS